MENYKSLADALAGLQERGYVADFATDAVCLYCGEFDIRLHPGEFQVDKVYRFAAGPGQHSSQLLYAITSSTGVKGTLTDAAGAPSTNLDSGMPEKLKNDHVIAF